MDYTYAGFVAHKDLPLHYAQARLLLLPTSRDCWGVVINEAMVSGTPVVTTNMTAAAGELVLHEENGLVLPLREEEWAGRIASLLDSPDRLSAMATAARESVAQFSFETAATGIVDAIEYAERM